MAKEIKNIEVKMTFKVGLGGYDISDKAFKQLKEIQESGLELSTDSIDAEKYPEALGWLDANIDSTDAFEWKYEVEEIE